MRKFKCSILCLWIILTLILPCGALSIKPATVYDYNGYLDYVNFYRDNGELPENFIYYAQISVLGEFIDFSKLYGKSRFQLQDKFDAVFFFNLHSSDDRYLIVNEAAYLHDDRSVEPMEISIETVDDLSNMTKLEATVSPHVISYITVGELTYYYLNKQNLDSAEASYCVFLGIYWNYNDCTYSITAPSHKDDYPAGQDTLVGRMLNYETAEAALAELIAFMDANVDAEEGALKKARQKAFFHEHMPLLAGCGIAAVIVIPTAIALPIVIVKRKRKKKAERASGE